MVYNPSGRTTSYFALWSVANAATAVVMALLAAASEGSTRIICVIAAVLLVGIAVAGVVAVAKLRRARAAA